MEGGVLDVQIGQLRVNLKAVDGELKSVAGEIESLLRERARVENAMLSSDTGNNNYKMGQNVRREGGGGTVVGYDEFDLNGIYISSSAFAQLCSTVRALSTADTAPKTGMDSKKQLDSLYAFIKRVQVDNEIISCEQGHHQQQSGSDSQEISSYMIRKIPGFRSDKLSLDIPSSSSAYYGTF